MLCEVEGDEYRPGPKKTPAGGHKDNSNVPQVQHGKLRPCMEWALENSDLTGGEGNAMRHAIVVEAKFAGFSREDTIRLFEHLPDFSRKITDKQVDNAWKNDQHTYNC